MSKLDELVDQTFDIDVEGMWGEMLDKHIRDTQTEYKTAIRAYNEERYGPLMRDAELVTKMYGVPIEDCQCGGRHSTCALQISLAHARKE